MKLTDRLGELRRKVIRREDEPIDKAVERLGRRLESAREAYELTRLGALSTEVFSSVAFQKARDNLVEAQHAIDNGQLPRRAVIVVFGRPLVKV